MGVVLWHGTISARRHDVACPRCLGLAAFDCDTLGRTTVLCACSPGPFLMPVSVGPTVDNAWPIILPVYPPEPGDRPRRKTRSDAGVSKTGHYCDYAECGRPIGPLSRYCRAHSAIARAERESAPCANAGSGCTGRRGNVSPLCEDCRAAVRSEYVRAQSMARVERARAARGGIDGRGGRRTKGVSEHLGRSRA